VEAESLEEGSALARNRTALQAGEDLSAELRRAAIILLSGRVVATIVPVLVILLVAERATGWRPAAVLAVQCLLWLFAAAVGYSIGGPTLTALGPRVAVARGVLLGIVLSGAAQNWLPGQHISFPVTLCVAMGVFVAGASWETFALEHVRPVTRLLIVGGGRGAQALIDQIREGRGFGYQVVGVVRELEQETSPLGSAPVLGSIDELESVIAASRPDIVVLAPGINPETFNRLLDAAEAGFRVVELAQFYEHAYGRVPVEDLTRAWFLSVLHLYQRPYSRLTKRTVDIVGAFLLLLLTLPLFPVLVILVRLSEGPILLRQVRLGEHGRLFTMYKFRTMRVDAEAHGEAVWAAEEDPRITRVGGVLRRLRLDELPQLWNIARGDMSLVGPRPERPEFSRELTLQVPYWTRRHLVKPGITGWAQVRRGYTASSAATSEKLSYDLWYIRHRSLTVDIAILLRTLAVVLRGDRSGRTVGADDQTHVASLADELVGQVQQHR
jgi:exopolysaccharide biosynthesis polyprenyl glycosylphosphotransferase